MYRFLNARFHTDLRRRPRPPPPRWCRRSSAAPGAPGARQPGGGGARTGVPDVRGARGGPGRGSQAAGGGRSWWGEPFHRGSLSSASSRRTGWPPDGGASHSTEDHCSPSRAIRVAVVGSGGSEKYGAGGSGGCGESPPAGQVPCRPVAFSAWPTPFANCTPPWPMAKSTGVGAARVGQPSACRSGVTCRRCPSAVTNGGPKAVPYAGRVAKP